MGVGDGKNGVRSWAEWFERRAQLYDDPLMKMAYYVDGRPLAAEVVGAIARDVAAKLDVGERSSVLDVGGGIGILTQPLRARAKRIVTTDISFAMARDGVAHNRGGAYLVCDAGALPFTAAAFDRVLCYSVFHYFSGMRQAERALEDFLRVAKRPGRILIGDVLPAVRIGGAPLTLKRTAVSGGRYPASLRHDLSYLRFDRSFFTDFCGRHGGRCSIVPQRIDGKATALERFDVIIEV